MSETVLGRGLYSLSEAAALTGLNASGIRRYAWGHQRRVGDRIVRQEPAFRGDYPLEEEGPPALSFLDLTELRVIREFVRGGVPWQEIRRTSRKAAALLRRAHPFSTVTFYSDGDRILRDELTADHTPQFEELATKQLAFEKLLRGGVREFEFEADELVRWAPAGAGHAIVLDPERSFGQPILRKSGVPARSLVQAYYAFESVEEAADWYRVDQDEVRAAIEFEPYLAA